MTYNGWKNYETWAVGLWLDGNYDGEDRYLETRRMAEDIAMHAGQDRNVADGIWTVDETRRFRLADALASYTEDAMPESSGLAGDLIGAALSEVDWYELADHLLSELEVAR